MAYIQGKPYCEDRSWFRNDTWEATGAADRVFVAGPYDDSPHQEHGYPQHDYNADCSCCWLNITHSQERHRANLAEHNRAVAVHRRYVRIQARG